MKTNKLFGEAVVSPTFLCSLLEREDERCVVTLFLHWSCWEDYLHEQLLRLREPEMNRVLGGEIGEEIAPYLLTWLRRHGLKGWVEGDAVLLFDECTRGLLRLWPNGERCRIDEKQTAAFVELLLPADIGRRVAVVFLG